MLGKRFIAESAPADDPYREVVVVGLAHGSSGADPAQANETRYVVQPVAFGASVQVDPAAFSRAYAPVEADAPTTPQPSDWATPAAEIREVRA